MHKDFLKNLSRIKPDQLGVLKNCTAVLGKSESGSLLDLFNNKSKNWWWKSIGRKELTPDYYAVVLFISYVDFGIRISLKTHQNILQSKIDGVKASLSATICGIMIGNIIFVKDAYNDKSYKFNFDINTEDNVQLRSIGTTSENVCFRGIFDLKTCPFYCSVSF